ncbi:Protein of unknown function [Gryllus bimaculatus]|nr:Protein of unknown function [Gryllus bimaculatus]
MASRRRQRVPANRPLHSGHSLTHSRQRAHTLCPLTHCSMGGNMCSMHTGHSSRRSISSWAACGAAADAAAAAGEGERESAREAGPARASPSSPLGPAPGPRRPRARPPSNDITIISPLLASELAYAIQRLNKVCFGFKQLISKKNDMITSGMKIG